MYLIERVIGIATYSIILLLICQFISKSKNNNRKKILNIYLLCLVLMAYFFVPPPGEDLYVIIPVMKSYASLSTTDLLLTLTTRETPLASLYYHIIGKFNLPGLLPAITALIVYSNIFYIINDFAEKYKIENKHVSKTLFYIMSTGFYVVAISNIRTLLSFSILAVAIYKEYFCNQKIIKSVPSYIVSFLIHSSSLIIIGIRFISLIMFEKKSKPFYKIFFGISLVIGYVLFEKYFNLALEKFIGYYTTGTFFLLWEFIKITILLIYILYIINYSKKLKKININDKNISKIGKLILLIVITLFILHKEFNLYLRVAYFCSIISMPVLLYILKSIQDKEMNKRNFYTITLFSCLIMLLLSCSRGHLSSLKFFDLNN